MDDWRRSVARIHPALRFCDGAFGMGGRTAGEPIPAGAELMSIPYSAIVGVETATARLFPAAPTLRDLLSRQLVTGRTLIYLYLLVAERDPDGHGPYLRSLPATHDDPLWWSAAELCALAGTNLEAAVEERRSALRRTWEVLFPLLHERHPGVFEPRAAFSWERFLWAHSSFTSRAFPQWLGRPPPPLSSRGVDGGASPSETESDPMQAVGCLLPALDTLNHGYRARITWVRHGDGLAFVTEDSIPAHTAVLNNYGPKSNEELLLGYGFVLHNPPNPQETLTVRFGALPSDAVQGGDSEGDFSRSGAVAALARWSNFDSQHVLRRCSASVARLDALHRTAGAAVGEKSLASSGAEPATGAEVGGSLPPDFLPYLRLMTLPDAALQFLWETARRWPAAPAAAVHPAASHCLCARDRPAFIRAVLSWLPLGGGAAAGVEALAAKQRRLVTCHPWLEVASDPQGGAVSEASRLVMAREYVRGQWDVLTDALAELRALPLSEGEMEKSPVAPHLGRAQAPPILSLAALPVVAPALAALLDSIDGLELTTPGDVADCRGSSSKSSPSSATNDDVDDSLERMQLALFLLHQRSVGAASPWHCFIEWAAGRYDPAGLVARADALEAVANDAERTVALQRGCPARAALSVAALSVGLQCIAAQTREAVSTAANDEAYPGLFPALSQSAPHIFPRRSCTKKLWAWATIVVDAECRRASVTSATTGKGASAHGTSARCYLELPRASAVGYTRSGAACVAEPAASGSKRSRAGVAGTQESGAAGNEDVLVLPASAREVLENLFACGEDALVVPCETCDGAARDDAAKASSSSSSLFDAACAAMQSLCTDDALLA